MATVVETVAPPATNGLANGAATVPATLNGGLIQSHNVTLVPAAAAKGAHAVDGADIPYTTFHLAACSFVHPGSRPSHIRQCCTPKPPGENGAHPHEQHIRLYHSEPSHLGYNRGCDIIRESRFSTKQGWYAPSADDLVADDAGHGSAVANVGWWSEDEVYETRVYYVDKNGKLRERWNRTSFKPKVHDDFERELPPPAKLVPPHPGWNESPLLPAGTAPGPGTVNTFPEVKPLAGSKFAAVRSEDGKLHVYYQAQDKSIHELVLVFGKGWAEAGAVVAGSDKAKPGSPLTAVSGGWAELRLFYVTPAETLAGVYSDDHTRWTPIEMPTYKLLPSAMLSAVAWNYASAFFEIRIFSTDDKNDLYEYSYNRKGGGWAAAPTSVSKAPVAALSPAKGSCMPLSAVAAVIVDDEWKTKVYFHPRRTIAEWDVCSKTTAFNGIPKLSAGAAARRQIEEETRAKIRQEEERKKHEAEEAKKKHDAEEAKKKHDAEEAAKKKAPLPNKVTLRNPIPIVGSLSGNPHNIDDVFHKLDLPFPVTVYGHASKTLWVTENGWLSLDTSTDARANRLGQALPSRVSGFPHYAIFAYWTDLMIAAGKPHGVYYEVSGAAPNRVLTVEWYVTRYKHEEQYFHFSATLEEARPNVVSFRYYDVADGGAEGTVGVQGPNAHMQFSHNQAKLSKGLQVTFDMAANKMEHKQFPV